MGNREDLKVAAAKLVRSRRFGAISARDIAGLAGSSTAAINYHFRTLDALMLGALVEAMGELGEGVGSAISRATRSGEDAPTRQEAFWSAIIESVVTQRSLWLANFEALLEAESRPELRRLLAESNEFGATEIATSLGCEPGHGRLVNALMVGVVVQHLLDPDAAPTAQQIAGWLAPMRPTEQVTCPFDDSRRTEFDPIHEPARPHQP